MSILLRSLRMPFQILEATELGEYFTALLPHLYEGRLGRFGGGTRILSFAVVQL